MLLMVAIGCRDTSKSQSIVSTSEVETITPQPTEAATTTNTEVDSTAIINSTHVLDRAEILNEKDIAEINKEIYEIENLNLAQVAVVTVNDLEGKKCLDYATDLANKLGVGHKETNDGITIVIKPKIGDAKGEAAIATGLGMENILTNDICQLIIDTKMIPKFKENEYGEGIEDALKEIKEILEDKAINIKKAA